MPTLDLTTSRQDGGAAGPADVIIIGTGPAGSTLARELSGTHLRVMVIESGGAERLPWADALNTVDNVGRARQEDQWSVRNRVLGGSSFTWGGRCTPFDEVDLIERSWIPESGWPLSLAELQPFLERSATHLGLTVGTQFNGQEFWRWSGHRRSTPDLDPMLLQSQQWQFSLDADPSYPFEYTRFGRHLRDLIGTNVTLLTGATVVRINPTTSGTGVSSVDVAASEGRRFSVQARCVVMAAGGIENARLLLASRRTAPSGLGNEHDLVGRFLMDHPRGAVGEFALAGSQHLQKEFGRYTVEGRLFRAGFRLSPEVQEREGLLNCASWLGEVVAEDDPWDSLRRLARRDGHLPSEAANVVRNSAFLARGARDYFLEHNGIPRKLSGLDLIAMVEQRPDRDSRVTLGETTDMFGVPFPRIDWRVHPDESRTVRRTAEIVVGELRRLGLPTPVLADWVDAGADFPSQWRDVAHPTGTTRMSRDPRRGVVDADSMVHGINGLYVAGSSVFPTAGHGNPTQMIVALAVRLADHLRHTVVRERITPSVQTTTVVLTGARGRLGRIVLRDLVDRGYRVRATTSSSPAPEGSDAVEWHVLDLAKADAAALDSLLSGADAVLHLAAEIGKQDLMSQLNVNATAALAEAAERSALGAFCYTSTVAVYGSGRSRTMSEDSPVLTVESDVPREYLALPYVRTYGRTKLAGELALRKAAKTCRYEILRPSVVVDVPDIIGIRDWSSSKRMFGAHRHAHHIYVRDVSDALIWALERARAAVDEPGRVEVFNLAEDEAAEPTHAAFMKRALRRTNDPRFRVHRVPGAADWAHDLARFRGQSLRNPLWRMRFPSDKILAAGWRQPFGIGYAQRQALAQLLRETAEAA